MCHGRRRGCSGPHMPEYSTLIDRFSSIRLVAGMVCKSNASRIMALHLTSASPTTHAHDDSLRSSYNNRYMIWPCCRAAAGNTALSRFAALGSERSRAPSANNSDVSSLSLLLEAGCSALSEVVAAVRLLRPLVALGLASGRLSSAALSWTLFLCRPLSLVSIGLSSESTPSIVSIRADCSTALEAGCLALLLALCCLNASSIGTDCSAVLETGCSALSESCHCSLCAA